MPTNDRRTFLKTVGVATGALGLTGTGVVLAQQDDDSEHEDSLRGWTDPGANSGRSYSTTDSGPTPYATSDLMTELDGNEWFEPLVADGTVYVSPLTSVSDIGMMSSVAAYDVETGERKWKQDGIPGPQTATVSDGTLYYTDHVGEGNDRRVNALHAPDTETGERKWQREASWSRPVVASGRVYVGRESEEAAYALDSETGETLWKSEGISGSPCYADGTVFFDGTALKAEDGAELWSNDTFTPYAVSDGLIYGSGSNGLEARTASDGTIVVCG
ncbi:outer membrane protein assembly factor BamB family protein [Haladaptatus cibarius]|uniref:outer membrane protein assembly factor BamB family protein n=1 Tax=Haladaptatus cibarius TaxID=453847 RepID=UPI00130D4DC3|nr:PQQ-binding-like beta-propeller repeat protein [Haladaptatus cibarius]